MMKYPEEQKLLVLIFRNVSQEKKVISFIQFLYYNKNKAFNK